MFIIQVQKKIAATKTEKENTEQTMSGHSMPALIEHKFQQKLPKKKIVA